MFSVIFGFAHGLIVIAICAPVWLWLGRFRRNTWVDAIALGFAVTFTVECALSIRNLAPNYERLALISSLYALSGAVGGATTWLVGRWRPES